MSCIPRPQEGLSRSDGPQAFPTTADGGFGSRRRRRACAQAGAWRLVVEISDNAEDVAGSRWKSRYLDALDAQERLQQEAGTRVGELGALLSRIARALPPAEAAPLVKRLGPLSDALKRRPLDPRLTGDLKGAHGRVLNFMEACERERAALLGALSEAAQQLEPVCSSRAFRRRLKAFRASLIRREPTPASALISNLRELQSAALETLPGGEAQPSEPLAEPSDALAAPEADGAPRASQRAAGPQRPLSVVAPAAAPGASPDVDWLAVRHVLSSLVARINLPEHCRDQAQHVAATLEQDLSDERLLQVLESIRDLVDASLAAMNGEFRGFLDSVDRRLDALLGVLGQAREDGHAALALERGMADSFQASIAAMRDDAARADRLDDLKSSIDSHLQRLVSSVNEFRERGDSLGDDRETRFEAMARRLQELETESREARGQLEVQRRLARTDALTGLPNRKALDERLVHELARARRHGTALALAIADIDHFKRVNDRYGHLAGDRALALLAGIITKRIRQSDFCARYGGEEFLILFPHTNTASAVQAVDEVRVFVESCDFSYRGEPVSLTASFGVTELTASDDGSSVVERADKALYAAKSAGRNTVCSA